MWAVFDDDFTLALRLWLVIDKVSCIHEKKWLVVMRRLPIARGQTASNRTCNGIERYAVGPKTNANARSAIRNATLTRVNVRR